MLLASEESATELLFENARGDSSNTVRPIDLKMAQWDTEPKITLSTKFIEIWELGCFGPVDLSWNAPGA